MNFSYLSNRSEFESLYAACREAEQFALSKPDVSALSARRAMEFIVKYIYAQVEPYPPYGCTVYDMIQDARFQNQFADPTMLRSIDFIRRSGNAAAHGGTLDAKKAISVLENLHYLVGEFAVGIGLIDDYIAFVPPNPLREALERVHPDNLSLNILRYMCEDGHGDWATAMIRIRKRHLEDLFDAPAELNRADFIEYLKKYESSMKSEVDRLVLLLPLSSATEREWEARRAGISKEVIDKIELYVQAYIEEHRQSKVNKHTYYVQTLGEKAMAYLWLVHPEYVPESMREAYVKPDVSEIGDADEYMPLEEAIKQLLRYFIAENPRKGEILSKRDWCKAHFGMEYALLASGRSPNRRESYSEERIHVGDKKYFVCLKWNKSALMYLRQMTGKLGEKIITMDRMADWGFAEPGSEAAKHAKIRAEKRSEVERLRANTATASECKAKDMSQTPSREADPEFSPREIRSYLLSKINLLRCLPELCSAQWSAKHFGFKHPILIELEEGLYLHRKQMDGNFVYSLLQLEYAGKIYMIHRMKTGEFERLRKLAEKLEWTGMRL